MLLWRNSSSRKPVIVSTRSGQSHRWSEIVIFDVASFLRAQRGMRSGLGLVLVTRLGISTKIHAASFSVIRIGTHERYACRPVFFVLQLRSRQIQVQCGDVASELGHDHHGIGPVRQVIEREVERAGASSTGCHPRVATMESFKRLSWSMVNAAQDNTCRISCVYELLACFVGCAMAASSPENQ